MNDRMINTLISISDKVEDNLFPEATQSEFRNYYQSDAELAALTRGQYNTTFYPTCRR